jgi:hypothetical protein
MTTPRLPFDAFYREVFLPEHQHPLNIAMHVTGTLFGLTWLALALSAPSWWKAAVLLFPVAHAAPGLLGHRLWERHPTVGDARWRRTDVSPWRFILANHRLALDVLRGRRPWRGAPPKV